MIVLEESEEKLPWSSGESLSFIRGIHMRLPTVVLLIVAMVIYVYPLVPMLYTERVFSVSARLHSESASAVSCCFSTQSSFHNRAVWST